MAWDEKQDRCEVNKKTSTLKKTWFLFLPPFLPLFPLGLASLLSFIRHVTWENVKMDVGTRRISLQSEISALTPRFTRENLPNHLLPRKPPRAVIQENSEENLTTIAERQPRHSRLFPLISIQKLFVFFSTSTLSVSAVFALLAQNTHPTNTRRPGTIFFPASSKQNENRKNTTSRQCDRTQTKGAQASLIGRRSVLALFGVLSQLLRRNSNNKNTGPSYSKLFWAGGG